MHSYCVIILTQVSFISSWIQSCLTVLTFLKAGYCKLYISVITFLFDLFTQRKVWTNVYFQSLIKSFTIT